MYCINETREVEFLKYKKIGRLVKNGIARRYWVGCNDTDIFDPRNFLDYVPFLVFEMFVFTLLLYLMYSFSHFIGSTLVQFLL